MAIIQRSIEPYPPERSVYTFHYRFTHLRGWAVLGLFLLILAVLGGMIWRNVERLEMMREFSTYQHHIQQVAIDIQTILTDYFSRQTWRLDGSGLAALSAATAQLAQEDRHVAQETPALLKELSQHIAALAGADLSAEQQERHLLQALASTNAMLDAENLQRARLVEEIGVSTRAEVELALAVVAALLVLVALFLRHRILAPLKDLEQLLLRLAEEDFTPIDTQRIDPLLLPVFGNYNLMVRQLAELKDAERHYAESLEAKVRAATQALLEQQVSLARSERLAAIGELAAGIAHELRNPLAGIQMTCVNLRNEIRDDGQAERISLVIDELKRMGRLLNELLDQARHTPEPIEQFDLPILVGELVTLVRYQIPPGIALSCSGPETLICRLPECRLRQCLLNLILNAAQAIGSGPGSINITIRPEGSRIALEVRDSGPGFSADLLQHGIRPFVTGRPGGTGLGLAMVQRFIRDLGGRLQLSNAEPHGGSVQILIPRQSG